MVFLKEKKKKMVYSYITLSLPFFLLALFRIGAMFMFMSMARMCLPAQSDWSVFLENIQEYSKTDRQLMRMA